MRQHAEKWHDCVMEDWRILVHDLNRNLLDYAGRKGGSLGSTLTAILIGAGQYQIVHVGDSRAYEIGENAVQITQDQSLVAREVRMGRLTGEQARLDKRRNILLQCLGVTRDVRPLFYQGKAKEACLYLVCTDGFWHSFRDEELSQELCRFAGNAHDLQDKLSAMILKCRESGERDNISVACMIPTQDHTRLAAEEADEERTLEIYGEPDTNDSAEAKDENGEDPTQEIPSVQGPLFVVDMEKRLSIL